MASTTLMQGKIFLNRIPIAQFPSSHIDKWDFIKLKSVFKEKDTIIRLKKTAIWKISLTIPFLIEGKYPIYTKNSRN